MARHLRVFLALQRTWVQFAAPTSGGSQLPTTPILRNLILSFDLHGHPNTHGARKLTQAHTPYTKNERKCLSCVVYVLIMKDPPPHRVHGSHLSYLCNFMIRWDGDDVTPILIVKVDGL